MLRFKVIWKIALVSCLAVVDGVNAADESSSVDYSGGIGTNFHNFSDGKNVWAFTDHSFFRQFGMAAGKLATPDLPDAVIAHKYKATDFSETGFRKVMEDLQNNRVGVTVEGKKGKYYVVPPSVLRKWGLLESSDATAKLLINPDIIIVSPDKEYQGTKSKGTISRWREPVVEPDKAKEKFAGVILAMRDR